MRRRRESVGKLNKTFSVALCLLGITLLLVSKNVSAQTNNKSLLTLTPSNKLVNKGFDDSVSSIRQRYASINKSLAKYRTVKKELLGFSTEGGESVAYFDGDAIMKIANTYQGETGRSFEDFYFWSGKLIFVFRKEDRYDEPYSGKVARTTENRFYFSNDRLIRWIDERARQVAQSNRKYTETQTHYLSRSKLFTEGARSKASMIEAP